MNAETAQRLLGTDTRVRVWNMQHTAVIAEGRVIAYQESPSIIIETDDGERQSWQVTLPIDEQHIEWRPA